MMCIVYIIAWLLAGTVVQAPNMLALLTYKNNPSDICSNWVHGNEGTEKGFLRSTLLSVFFLNLKLEEPLAFLLAP